MQILGTEDQIVAALRRIFRAVELHSRRLFEDYGLTGPQLTTLREAARCGRISISALARAIHLSQPTVTGIIARLERQELVLRERNTTDRRGVDVNVTVAGHKLLNRAPSLLQDRFTRKLMKLPEWEQTQMLSTLQRIATMMEADTLAASPVLAAGPLDASPPTGGNRTTEPTPARNEPVGEDASAQSQTARKVKP